MLAIGRKEMLLIAEVDQSVQPVDRLGPDRSALAAIAAIWPAELDKLFAPEADTATTAAARADIDFAEVEEFHGSCPICDRSGDIPPRAVTQEERGPRQARPPRFVGHSGDCSGHPPHIGPGRHLGIACHRPGLGIAQIVETGVHQHPGRARIVLKHLGKERPRGMWVCRDDGIHRL